MNETVGDFVNAFGSNEHQSRGKLNDETPIAVFENARKRDNQCVCNSLICNSLICNSWICNILMCNSLMCNSLICDRLICNSLICNSLICNSLICNRTICHNLICNSLIAVATYHGDWQPSPLQVLTVEVPYNLHLNRLSIFKLMLFAVCQWL